MRLRRLIVIAAVVVAGAAGAAAWIRESRVPVVEIATPRRGPAVQAIYATGVVEPVYWSKVTPLVRGRIVDLCRCEGQPIRKDDFLIRLDDREEKAKLAELEARERFLAREVERYRDLARSQAATIQAMERVTSEYGQVRAGIAAARERIAHMTLTAPMDGVVLRRDGEVGEVADAGQILFWVGKPRPIWVTAEIDEEDIPQIAPGQRAAIKADAFPDRVLEGRIDHVTPKGDPVNKNYRVRIALPDDTPLLIGMTTEINVIVRTVADALLVPREAVSGDRVWVVADGIVTARSVETGITSERAIEIRKGLAADERIVAVPMPDLADGARVRIKGGGGSWAFSSTSR